jgi:hypothetical protein
VGPSVQTTVATPFASVWTDGAEGEPLPTPAVNVTVAPDTGFPKRSTTITVGFGVAGPLTDPVGVRLLVARRVSAAAAFTVCAVPVDALNRKFPSPE